MSMALTVMIGKIDCPKMKESSLMGELLDLLLLIMRHRGSVKQIERRSIRMAKYLIREK